MKFGRVLFSADETFQSLVAKLKEGYRIRSTKLTNEFNFEQWKRQYDGLGIPLFVINKSGKTQPFHEDNITPLLTDHTLIALVPDHKND